MTSERKVCFKSEQARLLHYQHKHRGITFQKLFLPPTTERKVNMVGINNRIYRGSIPRVPEDQLPPEVDEASIDEEALYKEIRDINFPPVPEREQPGPSRRVGGRYTLATNMTLVPVQVEYKEEFEETLLIGRDGHVYKGTVKPPSKLELDKQLAGSKRPLKVVTESSSSRGFVEPSLVSLRTSSKPALYKRDQKSLIELPVADVGRIVGLIKSENMEKKRVRIKEELKDKYKTKPQQTELTGELEESQQTEETATTTIGSETEDSKGSETEDSKGSETEESKGSETEESKESETEESKASETEDSKETDTEATDTEGTDTEATDTEGTDTEATDTEATDTEATDTEATDTEETDTERQKETEAGELEKTDTGELEKTDAGEPEKIDTEEPEKTDTEEPEKTDTEVPEKTDTEEPEKIDTEEPEKIDTEEPEKTDIEETVKTDTEELEKTDIEETEKTETEEMVKTDTEEQKDTEELGKTDTDEVKETTGETDTKE